MRVLNKILVLISLFFIQEVVAQSKYKCMVQMTNYSGEPAYLVVSLINPQGEYEKTLYMFGDDNQWYDSLKEWFGFYQKKQTNIDAVTGASITGGDRKIITLSLDESKLNKGYKIRFESAVEDKNYYTTDAEVSFTSEGMAVQTKGKGYVRYVKFNKAK